MKKIDAHTRLEGNAVLLLPLQEEHFEALVQIGNDPAIWQFLAVDMSTALKRREAFEEALKEREKGAQFPFVIVQKKSGALIGSTRLMTIEPQHNKLEIGWTWLQPNYWAGNTNLECKLLLLEFCFEELKVNRVQLKTDENNQRSRKAIAKIGASFEGILRNDIIRANGTHRNTVYFSMLDTEWPEKKTALQSLYKKKRAAALSYRKGNVGDLEALRLLGLRSYGQFRETLSEAGWKKMEAGVGNAETYAGLLRIATCFVCEEEGKLIGMAFQVPSGNAFAFFEDAWSYIRLVGVDPLHEGKGIGRRLTELCVEEAKQNGEKIIALHTSEFQSAARHIYESMGFKVLKELEPIFDKKYWLYTMEFNKENKEIVYRNATKNDLEDLVELRMQFTTLLTGINAPDRVERLREQVRQYFSETLNNGTSIWIMATHEGKPVGTGGILIRKNPPNFKNPAGDIGYLVNMYTIPEFRRRGICSRLMQVLEEEAMKTGIKAFELHATREGEFVYQQQGFVLHDEPTYRKYL